MQKIQHAGIYFSGVFKYDLRKINNGSFLRSYTEAILEPKDAMYFNQRYYPNWLSMVFPEKTAIEAMGIETLNATHITRKDAPELLNFKVSKTFAGTKEPVDVSVMLNGIKVFFFKEGIAIFSISLSLPEEHQNFSDISDITNNLRNTTHNMSYPMANPLESIIIDKVIKPLGDEEEDWKRFNPQLKMFLNIDVNSKFASEAEWDNMLIDLASVTPIGTASADLLYSFNDTYQKTLLANNSLQIYKNWKTICLYDSIVRISINLKEVDKHVLWESEYYYIYIFTSYIRYYLYRINYKLSITHREKDKENLRDNYFDMLRDVDLVQISYKFLQNSIFEKLIQSMLVKEEMIRLENKLNRIDTLIREKQELKISRILLFITLLTVISTVKDAWELVSGDGRGVMRIIVGTVVGIFILTFSIVAYRRRRN
jgi:hypothetical protein